MKTFERRNKFVTMSGKIIYCILIFRVESA